MVPGAAFINVIYKHQIEIIIISNDSSPTIKQHSQHILFLKNGYQYMCAILLPCHMVCALNLLLNSPKFKPAAIPGHPVGGTSEIFKNENGV